MARCLKGGKKKFHGSLSDRQAKCARHGKMYVRKTRRARHHCRAYPDKTNAEFKRLARTMRGRGGIGSAVGSALGGLLPW